MCLQVQKKVAVVAAAAVTEQAMAQEAAAVREQVAAVAAAAVTVQDTALASAMEQAPALRAIPRCLRA